MNTKNTASQPNVASIGDDAQFHQLAMTYRASTAPYVTTAAWFEMVRYLDSKLRAPADQAASVAPEGYALVPLKMTDEMRDRGNEIILDRSKLVRAYDAMVAAAPQQSLAPAVIGADHDEAVLLLSAVFDAWENGVDCHEDGDPSAAFVGKSFTLDDDIFDRCCTLLNRLSPPRRAAAEGQVSAAAGDLTDTELLDAVQSVSGELNYMDYRWLQDVAQFGVRTAIKRALRAHKVMVWPEGFSPSEGQAQTSAAVDVPDALSSLRWMYRRLPMAFGRSPSVEKTITALAAVTGDNVEEDFSERASKFECFSERAALAAQSADKPAKD